MTAMMEIRAPRMMFAKQAQAALFSLGIQAGQKSLFETAEAYKEIALGMGNLAIGNGGGAVLNFSSAAMHGTAAVAYGVLSGGAVAGSLGIGAMRGSVIGTGESGAGVGVGGGGYASGGGGGRASAGGGGMGGSQGEATTVINFNYEAGSMDSSDRRKLDSTVAKSWTRANRSGFHRLGMARG